jgi:hypothetical protein
MHKSSCGAKGDGGLVVSLGDPLRDSNQGSEWDHYGPLNRASSQGAMFGVSHCCQRGPLEAKL